jgi:hypothetical protein
VFRRELGIIQSFTLETSFGGVSDGPRAGALYDEIIWKEIGAKCGEALYHLLIGQESPLSNYVGRELELMNPGDDGSEEDRDERKLWPAEKQLAEGPEVKLGRIGRFGTAPGHFWHMGEPRTFLVAHSLTVSTEPPEQLAPKWAQMRFSLD